MLLQEIHNSPLQWKSVTYRPYNKKYEVSTTGLVRNKQTGKIVQQWEHASNTGTYMRVTLRVGQYRKNFRVHRLVAATFLPNTRRLPEVDHLDGNRLNNDVSNLEWVSSSENQRRRAARGQASPNQYDPYADKYGDTNPYEDLEDDIFD